MFDFIFFYLGVGVALTLQSEGDTVLSLLLTVVSNMLGIITIPIMLGIYLHNIEAVNINPISVAYKLSITVLAPTLTGIFTRYIIPNSAVFSKKYKIELSTISTINLAMIVWMALSNARDILFKQDIIQILLVIAISMFMHLIYICFNTIMVSQYLLKIPLKQAISVVIMSSQKSSPVGLAVISNLAVTSSQKGLFAIPCIIGQLTQIFIGSLIAPRLAKWVERSIAAQTATVATGAVSTGNDSNHIGDECYDSKYNDSRYDNNNIDGCSSINNNNNDNINTNNNNGNDNNNTNDNYYNDDNIIKNNSNNDDNNNDDDNNIKNNSNDNDNSHYHNLGTTSSKKQLQSQTCQEI